MTLASYAEQQADKARDLPEFQGFSLPGFRAELAEWLALIGRVEGLFGTYTKHDISHIDSMLSMLDWLVPDETKSQMTPADWLLAVLAVYLHDLGMFVTQDEFTNRHKNPAFERWFQSLRETKEGQDYLARSYRMNDAEKERFFFQEYIRMGHAQRIRDWVTGRDTTLWGKEVQPVAEGIDRRMTTVPARFRQYLGLVCESHHLDDLYNLDKYPLYAPCGNQRGETVNVQYAAILLRSADLLHVTKDRTPSIMYQAIQLSDPKSVEEWDKQRGTFAVRSKKRKLKLDDPETAIIRISANFTEERPLFALQEYIAYANGQVAKSRDWAEKSRREDEDADGYQFPWHAVESDVQLEGVPPYPLKFELDRGRLLDLLVGHTIYNDATVAVRELLQNAIDAVRFHHHQAKRKAEEEHREPPDIGHVRVKWEPATRRLSVIDNGIGMDKDAIENHLMKVGVSYYSTPQFDNEYQDFSPISRFGIGVLTCFMVSDDIEIVTCRGKDAHRVRMTSVHADYLLRRLEPGDALLTDLALHGTRVTLRVRDTIDLTEKSIRDIVRHWIVLPACPVEYFEPDQPVETIGFKSVEEALRHYQSGDMPSDSDDIIDATEVIVKSRSGSNRSGQRVVARYDLAFGVRPSRWVVERTFSDTGKTPSAPAVCIEGIRVADALPLHDGRDTFIGSGGIGALLAVSGDRRFRTTVSRGGLEQDTEYERVGGICAEMLFEHIKDELARISEKPGKPLSQASSASRWLYQKLRANMMRKGVEVLEPLYARLACIVIEGVGDGNEPRLSRRLVSSEDLQRQAFWSVESRLVDSLGLIARDLGREFGVSEFLTKFASDSEHLSFSPMLPDAWQFASTIKRSHVPVRVEFSRRHQQAAIRWEPGTPDYGLLSAIEGSAPDVYRIWVDYFDEISHRFDREWRGDLLSVASVGEISGDDDKIQGVRARTGLVLIKGRSLENLWRGMEHAAIESVKQADPSSRQREIAQAVTYFAEMMQAGGPYRPGSPDKDDWLAGFEALHSQMKDQDADVLPMREIWKQFDLSEVIFDPSSYWRDWNE